MLTKIGSFKKDLFKTPARVAFVAAVAGGFLVHLFGLLNLMHNYDDIFVHPVGWGSTIQSGRWGLALVGGVFHLLFGTYNVPLIYGLILLVFLGFSAAQLVKMFDVRSYKIAAALGGLLVVFPAVTSTLFFKFTAHYYGLAIFLAVVAARKLAESKRGFWLGTLFMVLSLSIYQAYLPLTIGLLVLVLLKRTLEEENATFLRTLRTGLFFCLSILAAVAVYRVMVDVSVVLGNKILVLVRQAMPGVVLDDFTLLDYQGINTMGQFTLSSLLASVMTAYKLFFLHPFNGFCGLAPTALLQVVYPLLWALTIVAVVVPLIVKKKRFTHIGGAVLLLLLLPLATNFISVMCPDSDVYTIMAYGFVLVPCAPLLLYESWRDAAVPQRVHKVCKRVLTGAIAFMLAAYAFWTPVNYTYLYFGNRQTENYFASMVTQIRMTEDFTDDKPWAFIGRIRDPLLKTPWDEVPIYGGNAGIKRMYHSYSRNEWITNYVGYKPKWASDAKVAKIKKTAAFKEMPIWPDEGSIRVIDGCVVVRFQ